jgi:hypothetical protein
MTTSCRIPLLLLTAHVWRRDEGRLVNVTPLPQQSSNKQHQGTCTLHRADDHIRCVAC